MAFSAVLIEQHVRHLRRYASILTGSKETGDKLILACLLGLSATSERLRPGFGRLDLFCAFHGVVSEVEYAFRPLEWPQLSQDQTETLQRLGSLKNIERAVLILRKVEQFEIDDVARITGLPRGEITPITDAACKILAGIEHHSVLIIEDEFFIARDLSRIVEEMGHSVCAIVGSADAAIKVAASRKPSLLLADLRLADGQFGGIRAAEKIASSTDIPVVYVTAYPDKATASHGNDILVVRKPFHPASVIHAVNQALTRRHCG